MDYGNILKLKEKNTYIIPKIFVAIIVLLDGLLAYISFMLQQQYGKPPNSRE